MKYVPSLPPPRIIGVGDNLTVTGPAAVKATKVVQPRSLQPLVTPPPHERREPERGLARERESLEKREDRRPQGERRTYCRRIRRLPVLVELRSGLERRRHNQRAADPTEHIDIEA